MPFVGELLEYVFKFVILAAVAATGVLCGAKYKKNKLAKDAETLVTEDEQA